MTHALVRAASPLRATLVFWAQETLPTLTEAKLALYSAMRAGRIGKADRRQLEFYICDNYQRPSEIAVAGALNMVTDA